MSKKANPTVIGGFVVGAVALVIGVLAVLGSGKLFTHRLRAVTYFQGNIQGLTVGSAVNLRGVQVGAVSDIELRLDVETMQPVIPVYLEFDTKRLHVSGAPSAVGMEEQQQRLETAIANGLHARLATQSLVTGQLVVELDLDPNEPRRLVGADPSTIEIPTSQSDIDKLKDALTHLPLDNIATAALKFLQDADNLVSSEDVPKLLQALASAGDNLDALTGDAHAALPPLVADLHQTLAGAREALTTTNQLMSTDLRDALRVAIGTLQKAEKTVSDADGLLAPNSPQRYDLDQTLRNLTATTRALRLFTEDLERRPNSLVLGK